MAHPTTGIKVPAAVIAKITIARCQSDTPFCSKRKVGEQLVHGSVIHVYGRLCSYSTHYILLGRVLKTSIYSSHFGQNCTKGKRVGQITQESLNLLFVFSHDNNYKYLTLYVETYMTSQIVDIWISAWYKTNQNGAVHNEGSKSDEVVEGWTSQSNNPAGVCKIINTGRVH